ncbi:OLC1v1025261C1 [Oldenlandia corymbosa var. corymbosa]|nr:OLC1v1025261C1 [Oldenlandia corymbosa var. corymbosa]
MVDNLVIGNGSLMNLTKDVRVEEDEEEFRSCCEDENELREREELVMLDSEPRNIDEHSVKMYFKGVSVAGPGDSGSGFSGIGVVMKRSDSVPPIQVQKMLDFYVEEPVANYLALMDGLAEARQNNIKKVYAFTDSQILYGQVLQTEELENPLLMALKQRVAEHTSGFEEFTLQIVHSNSLQAAVGLARVAVGVISEGNDSTQCCSICCEEKLASMMMTIKCSHTFCSHCMKKYVKGKLESTLVPIRCPQLKCKYYLSVTECKAFLPVISYTSLEKALADTNLVTSENIYCPYPNCAVLLDPHECSSSVESSSSSTDNCCVECPVCQGFICVDCGAPWHSSTTCEENQSLQLEDRDLTGVTRNGLAQNRRQRQCQHCGRMIKLSHGSYHLTCR